MAGVASTRSPALPEGADKPLGGPREGAWRPGEYAPVGPAVSPFSPPAGIVPGSGAMSPRGEREVEVDGWQAVMAVLEPVEPEDSAEQPEGKPDAGAAPEAKGPVHTTGEVRNWWPSEKREASTTVDLGLAARPGVPGPATPSGSIAAAVLHGGEEGLAESPPEEVAEMAPEADRATPSASPSLVPWPWAGAGAVEQEFLEDARDIGADARSFEAEADEARDAGGSEDSPLEDVQAVVAELDALWEERGIARATAEELALVEAAREGVARGLQGLEDVEGDDAGQAHGEAERAALAGELLSWMEALAAALGPWTSEGSAEPGEALRELEAAREAGAALFNDDGVSRDAGIWEAFVARCHSTQEAMRAGLAAGP